MTEEGPTPGAAELVHRRTVQILLAVAVAFLALCIGLVFAFVSAHAHDDDVSLSRAKQAQREVEVALCDFMRTRAAHPGSPDDSPSAKERNDALAADAAKLLQTFNCAGKGTNP